MRPVSREHPITNPWGKRGPYAAGYHTGVDFGCPVGTSVVAPHPGKIVTVGYDDAYGNYVTLMWRPDKRPAKLFLFAHCSKIVVKKNQIVKRGQLIAKSGNTGNSTGPHLHAEQRHAPFTYYSTEKPPWI